MLVFLQCATIAKTFQIGVQKFFRGRCFVRTNICTTRHARWHEQTIMGYTCRSRVGLSNHLTPPPMPWRHYTLHFRVKHTLNHRKVSSPLTRSLPALQIGILQDTESGCDVAIVLFFRLPPNLDGKTGSFSERQVVMEPSQLLRIPLKVLSRAAILQAKKTMALETSIEDL